MYTARALLIALAALVVSGCATSYYDGPPEPYYEPYPSYYGGVFIHHYHHDHVRPRFHRPPRFYSPPRAHPPRVHPHPPRVSKPHAKSPPRAHPRPPHAHRPPQDKRIEHGKRWSEGRRVERREGRGPDRGRSDGRGDRRGDGRR